MQRISDTTPSDCEPATGPLTEDELDAAVRRALDPRIEPWHLPHITGGDILLSPPARCTNACRGLRAPCTCERRAKPLLWSDLPEHWQTRIVAVALAIVVIAVAFAAGWWSEIMAHAAAPRRP